MKHLIQTLLSALRPFVQFRGYTRETSVAYMKLANDGQNALDDYDATVKPLSENHVEPDPAAAFGAAMSVYEAFKECGKDEDTLSDVYGGFDEFMRQCIRVGTLFEEWACRNIKFEALEDVWPYTLHDNFGTALAEILTYDDLESFDETHCETLAASFKFPRR